MTRRPQQRDDSFITFVQRKLAERHAVLTEEVMSGLEDHGRYRSVAGRAAGIDEAEEILLACWKTFGTEDDDEQ